MNEELKEKIINIKLVIMDVDGVLTDGKIIYGDYYPGELKSFDVKDGYGVYLLNKAGIDTAIITAGRSKIVKKRARDMKISCVYHTRDKLKAYRELKKKFKLEDVNICYIGDDYFDLPAIKKAGFSACVCDAIDDIKSEVDYTSEKPGGGGAVREIVELVLKTKGLWDSVIES